MTYQRNCGPYDDDHPLVNENPFLLQQYLPEDIPSFEDIKSKLPIPIWQNHDDTVSCYYKAWEIAFGNLFKPSKASGFIANYIDAAFNGCIFMWDSAFMLMFGKYADRIFKFQKTLNNFYAKQHCDGFICRQISEENGEDSFHRFDPTSTGPNILPWVEWEYYLNFSDKKRIENIFPALLSYHLWLKEYRTWLDGSYWSSGLGCGMDNQPRTYGNYHEVFSHGKMVWVDACFQQVLSCNTLIKMAKLIGRENDVAVLKDEINNLTKIINQKLWDCNTNYYYDLWENGQLSSVKTIGAYWGLLSECIPKDRIDGFIAHLENEKEFKRPHRIPSLSADHPAYFADGKYWQGSVWAPTNYMTLKGLEKYNYYSLAYEIARNHVDNVTKVFNDTGTLWENYAPEAITRGGSSLSDFVGWTGLVPISILFENVFGICADAAESKITWRINLTEKHGIKKYPLGKDGELDLICESRKSENEEPVIKASSNIPLTLNIIWKNGQKTISVNK